MSSSITNDMQSWQAFVTDDWKMNQLTFPGTHNSHATDQNFGDGESTFFQPFTTTQSGGIYFQLEAGVRYIDIRLGNPNFAMRHGRMQLKGDLFGVAKEIQDYLTSHTTEAVLVSIKWDADDVGQPEPQNMGQTVWDLWQKYGWYHGKSWPKLGDVRGKAILLRRYGTKVSNVSSDDEYPGIAFGDVYGHESKDPPGAWKQGDDGKADNMSFNEVWDRIWPQINHASEAPINDDVQWFTFASHTGWKYGTTPLAYANELNPRILRHICDDNHHEDPRYHRYGCIVVDFFQRSHGLEMVSRNWESIVFKPDPNGEVAKPSNDPVFTLHTPHGDKVEVFFSRDAVLRIDVKGVTKWTSGGPADQTSDDHRLVFQADGNLIIWKAGGGGPDTGYRSIHWETGTHSGWDSRVRFTAGPPYILLDFSTGAGQVLWAPVPH